MDRKKIRNLLYLLVFTSILLIIKFFVIDKVFNNLSSDASIWFSSGLLLIVLGIFVTEKYFTKPLDVLVNVITLFIVLLTLNDHSSFFLYSPLLFYLTIISIIALLSFVLISEEKDPNLISQRIARSANVISGFLGSSKMLFSIVFILSLFSYFIFSLQNQSLITPGQVSILLLIIFWVLVILIEPIDKKLIGPLWEKIRNKQTSQLIGKIEKRLNPNILYVKQLVNTNNLEYGDLAIINNLQQGNRTKPVFVMYISELDSDSNKYLQFYVLNSAPYDINKHIYIFKHNGEIPEEIINSREYKNRTNIIGFVNPHSTIDIVKIKMIQEADEQNVIKEGDLISIDFYKTSTKYQIINVETDSESIDGQSKGGIKVITAQQVGYWESDKQRFTNMGWAPHPNSPVFLETSGAKITSLDGSNYRIGVVPRSEYPIYLNLDECINHHIAVIGKTGTGKSQMSAKIIEKLAKTGYKVVILEVDRSNAQSLSQYIDQNLIEEQDASTFDLNTLSKSICSIILQVTPANKTGGTLNLSDVAANLIDRVIQYQINHPEDKICVVMEEAYDFIPESSFGNQQYGQPTVSRISQQVLKCRKHNIGFLIITQRTALVTKTILYQCHTIIALQSFDETSKNFMSAYINSKYLDSMSILPRFRAIIVGKGSSCDKPVIVDFFDEKLVRKA